MSKLKELIQVYKSNLTVPEHPEFCPECGSKVSVVQMTFEEAVFMCSNGEVFIFYSHVDYVKMNSGGAVGILILRDCGANF